MTKDMTKGSLAKALILFSIPLMLSGLLQQLYSWADAFIVGNAYGGDALAAIGATNVVTSMLIMAMVGFTSGVSILSAQHFGMGHLDIQKNILSTFLVVLGGAFLVLGGVGAALSGQFLRLLETPEDIFDLAVIYLQIIMIGIPFMAVYNVYAAVLRGLGDSRAPFYSALISSAINVILDILFVTVFRWGVAGAAAATVISQIVMAVYVVGYAVRRYEVLRLRQQEIQIDRIVLREGCALALPITLQSLISSGGNLILQSFMNGFGTTTVAAITTAYRVDSLVLLPVINMTSGVSTITAQNLGAGESQRVKKCLLVGTALMTGVSVFLTAVVVLFGGTLVEMFGVSAASALIGANFFRIFGGYYPMFGITSALRGYLEGLGRVTFTSVFSVLSLGVRILLSYRLKPVFGNMVIAYAEAFSWCFLLLPYGGMVLYLEWKRRKENVELL